MLARLRLDGVGGLLKVDVDGKPGHDGEMIKLDRVHSPWGRWVAIFSVLVAFAATGCGDDGPPELEVSPSSLTLAKGRMSMVSAKVDGRAANAEVVWRSADPAIATVTEGARGVATIVAIAAGQTTVTVSQDGGSARLTVNVSAAEVESLAITPAMPSLAAGTEADLTVTATLSDGTTSNVTAMVEWTSSDATKATVSAAGRLRGVAAGAATLTARLGTKMTTVNVTVTNATLTSLAITPAELSLPKGLTQQMTATGTFSNGTTQDLTSMVTWASSNAGTASIVATGADAGLLTGAGAGTATISATLNGVTGSAPVTITAAALESIAVTPADSQLAAGFDREMTAIGTYSDDSTQDLSASATWASSNPDAVTMNGRTATAVAVGTATITATQDGISGSTSLEVTAALLESIAITPADASVAKGLTQQLTATGTFSDDSTQDLTATVTWASGDTAVVQVSNADGSRGLATAIDIGTAEVTATQDGVTGTTSFETTPPVLTSVTVGPEGDLARGTSRQLTATARYSDGTTTDVTAQATWGSSDAAAITVDDATTKGLANALTTAGATISARFDGMTGQLAIGGCKILINEVQVASAAGAGDEWIELASTCTSTQNLTGLRLVYRSQLGGGGDQLNVALTTTLAPNEHKFWVFINFASVYPTASGTFGTGGSGAISGTAGGVGLRIGATGPLVDSMAYGAGVTNGFIEGAVSATPANGTAAARFPDRGDTDNNSVDFAARTPTPGAANL
jgi:Bacterial Ig-like domain (group 2)